MIVLQTVRIKLQVQQTNMKGKRLERNKKEIHTVRIFTIGMDIITEMKELLYKNVELKRNETKKQGNLIKFKHKGNVKKISTQTFHIQRPLKYTFIYIH